MVVQSSLSYKHDESFLVDEGGHKQQHFKIISV